MPKASVTSICVALVRRSFNSPSVASRPLFFRRGRWGRSLRSKGVTPSSGGRLKRWQHGLGDHRRNLVNGVHLLGLGEILVDDLGQQVAQVAIRAGLALAVEDPVGLSSP